MNSHLRTLPLFLLPLSAVVGCGYKPVGDVSKLGATSYRVAYVGDKEAKVAQVIRTDARGICRSKHKVKMYTELEEKVENTGLVLKPQKKQKAVAGFLTQVGNAVVEEAQEDDWSGELKFKCE